METPVADVAEGECRKGARIGYDPWLMTRAQVRQIAKGLESRRRGACRGRGEPARRGVGRPTGAADRAQCRSSRKRSPASRSRKRSPRRARSSRRSAPIPAILTDPASIAWLFNIRGGDIAHTPSPLAFAGAPRGRPAGALHRRAQALERRARPAGGLRRRARGARFFRAADASLAKRAARCFTIRRVRRRPWRASSRRPAARSSTGADPVALPKAKKNAAELNGARAAHLRDGVAMLRFLRFIETSAPGSLTEIDAAKTLEAMPHRDGGGSGRAARRHLLRCDLLHRSERRDQSLPRHGADQPPARSGRPLPDRFRRAVPRRHHRHHAHGAGRRALARAARPLPRPLHARSEGAYRHRDRRASRRARPGRSSILSRVMLCGRRGSISTTAPATASAPISPCTKARSASPRPATRRSSRA